jgi:hypothetical protein
LHPKGEDFEGSFETRVCNSLFDSQSDPLKRCGARNLKLRKKIRVSESRNRISYTDVIGSLAHESLVVLFMMRLW